MSEYLPELALVLALVLVNAVFAGTEIALDNPAGGPVAAHGIRVAVGAAGR